MPGDGAVQERHVVMNTSEATCEEDQLVAHSLASLDILRSRASLLGDAHGRPSASPDYSELEDSIDWGPRGSATVPPALSWIVTGEPSERSSVMKEKLKLIEETRLRRPASAWPPNPSAKTYGAYPDGQGKGRKRKKAGGEAGAAA